MASKLALVVIRWHGAALRVARETAGYSRGSVAKLVTKWAGFPCSWQAIKEYEYGNDEPSFVRGLAIAAVCQVRPADLVIEREGPLPRSPRRLRSRKAGAT